MRLGRKSVVGAAISGILALGVAVGTALPAQAAVNIQAKRYTTQAQCAATYTGVVASLMAGGYTVRTYHSCKYRVDNSTRPWLYEIHYW
jgi:uncharacterized membrane protein YdcZ (DUF606 family)